MKGRRKRNSKILREWGKRSIVILLSLLFLIPPECMAMAAVASQSENPQKKNNPQKTNTPPEKIPEKKDNTEIKEAPEDTTIYLDAMVLLPVEKRDSLDTDTILTVVTDPNSPYGLDGKIPFNPSPDRAVWLSALFPGLGQIYNRRYWKLPIIVGGFMGIGYATNWNNGQYRDYTQAYRDIMDNDPNTKSYMDFFPPNTKEEDLDKAWLTSVLQTRRDYFRRNRDLCIIFLVGLYLLCMVDAYVDASLAHFDISPNVSMDVQPTMFLTPADRKIAVGLNWALNF